MFRVKFLKTKSDVFLEKVQEKTELTFRELASVCRVHRRSFSDWKYNKYLMPLPVFKKLVKISRITPPAIKVFPDYRHVREAGRKGAFARNKIYGNPGTPEGRSKGGETSIQKLRSDPEFARRCSLLTRKRINYPKKSPKLAELMGITIGDGGISDYQVVIALNKETDRAYAYFVVELFKDLFNIDSTLQERKGVNLYELAFSSINLIELLLKLGLKKGNKVRQQVDISPWVKESKIFTINCLRGLFDTDGCFYIDRHRYKDKTYHNCGLCFRSYSRPVLLFFRTKLRQLGLHPTQNTKSSVSLRKEKEVIKYFQIVGTSNLKHLDKFRKYFKNKNGEVPKFWSHRHGFENRWSLRRHVGSNPTLSA